jgi:hypothetical protein
MYSVSEIPNQTTENLIQFQKQYEQRLTKALSFSGLTKQSGDKSWQRKNKQEVMVCRTFIGSISNELEKRDNT